MLLRRYFSLITITIAACLGTQAQDASTPQLLPGTERKPEPTVNTAATTTPQMVSLRVTQGTPLQVALIDEVRVRKVGQPIKGKIVEPVYAFDRVVIPLGSEVLGRITKIEDISGTKRTMAALDADFTPARNVEVDFNELVLPGGKHFLMQTSVTPGSGQVLKLVTSSEPKSKASVKDEARAKTQQAKQQAKDQWDRAMQQVKAPSKMLHITRYVEGQLPVHPQYIPAGTTYFAELREPLEFGNEPITPRMARSIGVALPPGAMVHARLVTPLSSATAHQGASVEAVLSQPLMNGNDLVLPEGSRLKGLVLQAQPAGHRKKNGQLRITFRELVPPDGIEQKVEATLAGVQAGKDTNVKLDSEGGAEATTPKTRYVSTAVSVALAMASTHTDHDGDNNAPGARAAGGVNGFKLIGMTVGIFVRSQPLGYAMGAYGAGMSVYSNFLARGHEVVFPKNTAMEIDLGTRKQSELRMPTDLVRN